MTGPPKSFAVTTGTNLVKTINGVTITEFVSDAFGTAGTANNTFCIDIASGNAVFGASPSLSVTGSGLATDLLQSIVVPDSTGPGGANARVSITIFNNPANVLSSLTLNNLVLNISSATVGSVRAILTDCGDQAGPGGSLAGNSVSVGFGLGAPFPVATDAFGGALSTGTVAAPLPAGNTGPVGGIGANFGADGPAVNDFILSANDDGEDLNFANIGNFSGPNDSVNDLNRVVLFFLLLADRSGGNDRVATARILQQEKYGIAGINLGTNPLQGCSSPGPLVNLSAELQSAAITKLCGGTRFALVATADNFPDALVGLLHGRSHRCGDPSGSSDG